MTEPFLAPSEAYWLGTDALGRPVLERLLAGTAETLVIIALTLLLAAGIGLLVANLAVRGRWAWLRVSAEVATHFAYALPLILLLLLLLVYFGSAWWLFPVVAGCICWASISAACQLELSHAYAQPWVQASRELGCSDQFIYRKHVSPLLLPVLGNASAALLPSLLQSYFVTSFISVGEHGLGALVRQGFEVYPQAWWLWLPASAVSCLLLGGMMSFVTALNNKGIIRGRH